MGSPNVKLEVTSDPKNLSVIRDFMKDAADRIGFSETEMEEIRLAVDEACANIMIHGYGHHDGIVTVTADFRGNQLIVSINDQAEPFDPISATPKTDFDAPLDERALGGMGVILMKQSTDALEYKRPVNGGNMLIMSKIRRS